ncbi:electron transport complex subunit RsxG [Thioalkalivibrio sp.]|uniref:electron transport complex subunit RsxG n=1 Tax=Thioalkalivibrio sp. TaxID=2093813 RepID=UPI003974DEFF
MARIVVRDMVITTLLLGLFAASGTGIVAWVHSGTEARIAENRVAMTRIRITQVLEGLDYDNEPVSDHVLVSDPRLGGEDLPIWFARRGNEVAGMALSTIAPNGYNGSIHLLIGIDAEGNVLGVRVTQHRETPGLGDDIEADRSDWIHGFRNRSLGDPPLEQWRVRKDGGVFDQFTGATITPRAVVQAIRNALLYFQENAETLLATPPAMGEDTVIIDSTSPEIPDPTEPAGSVQDFQTVPEPAAEAAP